MRPFAGRSRLLRRARSAGFTLLEIMTASAIFVTVIMFALWITADSYDQALAAENSRRLRMLAEMKAGEAAVFESYFNDEDGTERPFENLPDELRDLYKDWRWSLNIVDVVLFGPKADDTLSYYWGEAGGVSGGTTDGTTIDGGTGDTGGAVGSDKSNIPGTELRIRQMVLTVKSPENDGEGDAIEVVMFLPFIDPKAAGVPK